MSEKAVSYSQALSCFKKLLCLANLDPKKFGLHSPRRGGTTDAFLKKVPEFVIDLQGRWKCKNSKYRYVKLTDREVCTQLSAGPMY